MQLIAEIVELTTDGKGPISDLLRKCVVLSAKLQNAALKEWALKELNGYQPSDPLPEYRELRTQSLGHFSGPLGAEVRNAPLASAVLREDHQDFANNSSLRKPVAYYESLIERSEGGNLRENWPNDLVLFYQDAFIEGYSLVAAWKIIPPNALVALSDTIKTRVLTFALEIEGALDRVGDNPSAIPASKVNQHVTNIIYGGNNVFSETSYGFTQIEKINVSKGDLDSLIAVLETIGLKGHDIDDLKQAVEADRKNGEAERPGPQSSSWLTKALSKVGGEGLKVSVDVARSTLTKAVLTYFGIN